MQICACYNRRHLYMCFYGGRMFEIELALHGSWTQYSFPSSSLFLFQFYLVFIPSKPEETKVIMLRLGSRVCNLSMSPLFWNMQSIVLTAFASSSRIYPSDSGTWSVDRFEENQYRRNEHLSYGKWNASGCADLQHKTRRHDLRYRARQTATILASLTILACANT